MSEVDNQDTLRKLTFRSTRKIALSDGRSVSVSWVEGGGTAFRFVNNRGTETRFALTADATFALTALLSEGPTVVEHAWMVLTAKEVVADAEASAS